MNKYLTLVLISLLLISCKETKYIEVPIETIKTEYINKIQYDSIYIKDSVDRYLQGDTLVIYKEKAYNKYKFITDTVIVRDTIPTTVEVPVEVEVIKEKEVNKLYWYQRVLMAIGIAGIFFVILFFIYKYLKKQ